MAGIVESYAFGKIANYLTRSLKIGDYFDPLLDNIAIRIHGRGDRTRNYSDVSHYWRDEIGSNFGGPSGDRRELLPNEVVKLNQFKLTEWVPWSPGTIWTNDSYEMRLRAMDHIDSQGEHGTIYKPAGKTLMVCSGIGNVRFERHNNYKLLCATTESASHGIPIVLTGEAYDEIRNDIVRNGVIVADILGYHSPVADLENNPIDGRIEYGIGVPRNCILVDSSRNISIISEESEIEAHALSIFGDVQSNQWNFCFSSFDPKVESSIQSSANFLNNYAHQYNGSVLLDFDEICMRTNALFSLSDIARGIVNGRQLRLVINSIREYYRRQN
jgi:hypothetical protein